jgi:hypothetical protein
VAIEDVYSAYRETIAAVLSILRPHAEVETITLESFEEELERFDPQVVICSGHNEVEFDSNQIWIELSLDSTQPTKISVYGRHLERTNPTLEDLLEVIDEAG